MTTRWLAVSTAAAVSALAGCGGASGALTVDDSIEILEPAPLDVVTTPFDIRWEGDPPPGGSFAVFVDRGPIRPGQSLADAFEDACDGEAGCPDATFLEVRGVHLTDDTAVTIPLLAPRAGVDGASSLDVHRATVVIVDADGVRRGERAWSTEFRVAR